jgi:nucleotide-binding universal stress UspA family protein
MREVARILCPLDLSDVSCHAIDHAVLLARWYGARITVLHSCNPVVIPSGDFAVVQLPPNPEDIAGTRSRVAECLASAGGSDATVIVESGEPVDRILEHARTLPADLLVIGTHGVGGFEHLMLGSTTEKVLRKATCPVLTVPPRARATSKLPFKRILCPVDFSDSSRAALDFAFSLAQEGDAELTILHVLEWPDSDPLTNRPISVPEYRLELEADLTTKLDALVPDDVRTWCRPVTRMAHGKAYREILGIATEDTSDLIVMGVHGRNALDLMLFGSTTNQVVRRATCPVLTLRTSAAHAGRWP